MKFCRPFSEPPPAPPLNCYFDCVHSLYFFSLSLLAGGSSPFACSFFTPCSLPPSKLISGIQKQQAEKQSVTSLHSSQTSHSLTLPHSVFFFLLCSSFTLYFSPLLNFFHSRSFWTCEEERILTNSTFINGLISDL